MLILGTTSDKLQLTTSAAGASGGVDVTVSYAERTEATGAVTNRTAIVAAIATAATTDILAAPASGLVRNAKFITIRNKDTVLSNTVTLKWTNGTAVEIAKATLLVGEVLFVSDTGAWYHYDANGGVYGAVATAMKRVILTSGTAATYTPGVGCRAIDVRVKAAGGQGGGSTTAASSGGGGGGGGEGGLSRKLISPPAASYLYTVGAGGSGAAAGAAGNAGADSTFGGITAKGGSGGLAATAAAATRALGGAGGVAGTGGDTNDPGSPGLPGVNTTAALVASGAGGGAGAPGATAAGTGTAAGANTGGGGGGGVVVSNSAAVAGGAGGYGYIDITEFY